MKKDDANQESHCGHISGGKKVTPPQPEPEAGPAGGVPGKALLS